MAPQQYLPVFPFPSGREGDVREAVFDAWQPKATIRWKPTDALVRLRRVCAGLPERRLQPERRRRGRRRAPIRGRAGHARRRARIPGTRKTRAAWSSASSRVCRAAPATFSASGFYTRIDNAFTFFFVAPFNAQIIRNIDDAKSAGFEADISWLPVRGLQVDFAVGLLEYRDSGHHVGRYRRR